MFILSYLISHGSWAHRCCVDSQSLRGDSPGGLSHKAGLDIVHESADFPRRRRRVVSDPRIV
jgi:hypothetical protein